MILAPLSPVQPSGGEYLSFAVAIPAGNKCAENPAKDPTENCAEVSGQAADNFQVYLENNYYVLE